MENTTVNEKLKEVLLADLSSLTISILSDQVLSEVEFSSKEELLETTIKEVLSAVNIDSEEDIEIEDRDLFEEIVSIIKTKLDESISVVSQSDIDDMEFYKAIKFKDTMEVFTHNAFIPKGKLIDIGEVYFDNGFYPKLALTTETVILPYLEDAATQVPLVAPFLFQENMAKKYFQNAEGEVVIFGSSLGINLFYLLKNEKITKITSFDTSDIVVEYIEEVILPQLNPQIPVEVFSYTKGIKDFVETFNKKPEETVFIDIGAVKEDTLDIQLQVRKNPDMQLVLQDHLDTYIRLTLHNAITKTIESNIAEDGEVELTYIEEYFLSLMVSYAEKNNLDQLYEVFEGIKNSNDSLNDFLNS